MIKEYDSQWPLVFEELRAKISDLLGEIVLTIEHIGSTSVPGMAAKPIIDLDVLLTSPAQLPAAIQRLALGGYEHQGDLGIPGREAFRSPPDSCNHHLYVCVPSCQEFRRHLSFRNYLRSNAAEMKAYSNLKWSLWAEFGNDRAAYIHGKDAFTKRLAERAIRAEHMSSS